MPHRQQGPQRKRLLFACQRRTALRTRQNKHSLPRVCSSTQVYERRPFTTGPWSRVRFSVKSISKWVSKAVSTITSTAFGVTWPTISRRTPKAASTMSACACQSADTRSKCPATKNASRSKTQRDATSDATRISGTADTPVREDAETASVEH